MENNHNSNQAGKGDKPRNCFSQEYRDNFDLINWIQKKENEKNTDNSDNTTNQ
jgi:hypothetical protein